jgi:hypothetical protein
MPTFLLGPFLISAQHVHAARKTHEEILRRGLAHQDHGTLMPEGMNMATRWTNLDRLQAWKPGQDALASSSEAMECETSPGP